MVPRDDDPARGRPRPLVRRLGDALLAGEARDSVPWRSLGALFVLGGCATLGTLAAGVDARVDRPVVAALALLALVFGVLTTAFGARLPSRLVPLGLGLGIVVVAAAVVASGDADTPYSLLFAWVGAEAWYFLRPRDAGLITAFAVVASAAAFTLAGDSGDAVAWWVMIAATVVAVGALSAVLRLRSERLVSELSRAASHDALTGLLNRRGFRERVETELADARRRGRPLAFIVGDLDRFKALNDIFGHRAGDRALRAFAATCGASTRDVDVVARVGGEEFAIVVPGVDHEGGVLVAERLRRAVARAVRAPAGQPVTASFGVSAYPEHGDSAEQLLDRADQAMYTAKALGRDRSVLYSEDLPTREDDTPREQVQAVLALAETLDMRDAGTARHSHTVGQLCERTAAQLGLSASHVERVRLAGVVHDLGKLAVPDEILRKPGKLTDAEFAEMRRHAEIGARIVASAGLDDIAAWVLAHHERPDGRGYPFGLSGDAIPLEARILAVADSYEAMTADRPYRAALDPGTAVAELRRCAGTQFDRDVVDAFLAALPGRRAVSLQLVA